MTYRDFLAKTYGEVTNSLATGGTSGDASILLDAVASISTAVALIAFAVVFVFVLYIGLFRTNVEGKMFGGGWKAALFPLAGLICAIMIFPPLGGSGSSIGVSKSKDLPYSASQLLYLKAVVLGADFAQSQWDKYRPQLNNNAILSNVTTNSISASVDALSMLICAEYWQRSSTAPMIKKTLGGMSFGEGQCGQVTYPFVTPDNLKYAAGAKVAIENLYSDLAPLAAQIAQLIDTNTKANGLMISTKKPATSMLSSFIFEFKTSAQMNRAVADFRAASARFDSNIKSTVAQTLPASNAYDDWLKSGAITYDLAKRQRTIYDVAETISTSILYNSPSERADEFLGGEIRVTDLTNLAHKIAAQVISEDMNSGVKDIGYAPWSAIWNGGDGCFSCFTKHTAAYIRSSVLSSFNNTVAPQLSIVELGNRIRFMSNTLQVATYAAAPFRTLPAAGYVAEEAQNTFNRYIPKLDFVSSMLAVWAPRVPSAVWTSAVVTWKTSTILMVAAIPFAFILLLIAENGTVINRSAKFILVAAAATVAVPTFLVLGVVIFSGLISTIIGLFNDVYWADAVSNDISGITHAIADIQMYAWLVISFIASIAMFSFVGFILGLKKFIGADGGSDSDAQKAASSHSGAASGTGGAMSGGGTNAMIKRGSSIKGK